MKLLKVMCNSSFLRKIPPYLRNGCLSMKQFQDVIVLFDNILTNLPTDQADCKYLLLVGLYYSLMIPQYLLLICAERLKRVTMPVISIFFVVQNIIHIACTRLSFFASPSERTRGEERSNRKVWCSAACPDPSTGPARDR